ncbi:PRKC apoptosis WT1 regulator protein [Cyprinodon tularosa]|uniref:PRKC apoptosis WT1 regulator protein n=1 Tax=Cyprinodon tularosa TaxID=77115 RepID=UPI0018E20E59|nr:PRKC apoptosis WT1 regulator protein [Cyprinodon tularosa]XP_038137290.1 PRKC apoptosis WT1 regulator protein [Cyprinodon tularosa]
MATGGFKSNATTDFLEEWKAKREKMRAKMLGDIAAATGVPMSPSSSSSSRAPPGSEPSANPDRSASAGNCRTSSTTSSSSTTVARSPSSGALNRPEEEEAHLPAAAPTAQGSNLKKAPPQMEKARCASPDSSSMMACNDSDKDSPSPSPSKGKEKKSSGPSARKGKGQIEKRKLREKRRSTGVVSIPSNESLDELDDDDAGEKDRREEEELVQANTFQNESLIVDPATGYLVETPRAGSGRYKSSAKQEMEEEAGESSRQRENRHSREGGGGSLEKRVEELERELAIVLQEQSRLLKALQDKEDIIEKQKEEIELLNLDLDEIEDENEQLKQENKTLLKVVGQLTR